MRRKDASDRWWQLVCSFSSMTLVKFCCSHCDFCKRKLWLKQTKQNNNNSNKIRRRRKREEGRGKAEALSQSLLMWRNCNILWAFICSSCSFLSRLAFLPLFLLPSKLKTELFPLWGEWHIVFLFHMQQIPHARPFYNHKRLLGVLLWYITLCPQ